MELAEEAFGLVSALLLLPGRFARRRGTGSCHNHAQGTAEGRPVVLPRPPAVAGAVVARHPLEAAQGPEVSRVAATRREF